MARKKKLTEIERRRWLVRAWRMGAMKPWTHRILAKEWGIRPSTVARESARAKRLAGIAHLDVDGARFEVESMLYDAAISAQEDAEDFRGTREGLKARDQVIVAAKALADHTGASAPQEVHVKVEEVTPQRAAEIMREKFGKVTPGADGSGD